MSTYNIFVFILGIALLGAALFPIRFKDAPISLPMIYMGTGLMIPLVLPDLTDLDPMKYGTLTEIITQLAVIISLVSAGLKIDKLEGWRRWNTTWRLLGITMPLCIAALAFAGTWLLGLPIAVAVLMGAVMAPTDPVLASDVQVGPPGEKKEPKVRFALTSEAGLNDALAFPFVNLALVLAATGFAMEGLTHWLTIDVLWKIVAGMGMGILTGFLAGTIVPDTYEMAPSTEGFASLALTLVAYGATELIHGYGFLGVFIAARTFRHYKRDEEFYQGLHGFSEQIEKLLMTVLMIALGIAISQGLLAAINWKVAGIALLFIIGIRPLAVYIGLIGADIDWKQRSVIAVFGVRGIGSFYYLSYGLNYSSIGDNYGEILWATTGLIVAISVILHGVTVSYAMKKI